ncbi:MAG: DUF4391 domain-containing protein [Verrucomicrobiota bacterium]|nr:DUF4391 domain-containing protein [Verrucomicrobiota bacterium]
MREVARSAYDGEGAARAFIPAAIEAKMRERQQLKSRLEREKQFNRKVELNAALAFRHHRTQPSFVVKIARSKLVVSHLRGIVRCKLRRD